MVKNLTLRRWVLTLTLVAGALARCAAQTKPPTQAKPPPLTKPPTLKIPRVLRPPTMEDFLEMRPSAEMAATLAKLDGFIQRDPDDGKPASQRTEVYMGWDDRNLYAVFLCFDDHPDLIRSRMSQREAIDGDDFVAVFLDTYHDHQRAYEFLVNPRGIQRDGFTARARATISVGTRYGTRKAV